MNCTHVFTYSTNTFIAAIFAIDPNLETTQTSVKTVEWINTSRCFHLYILHVFTWRNIIWVNNLKLYSTTWMDESHKHRLERKETDAKGQAIWFFLHEVQQQANQHGSKSTRSLRVDSSWKRAWRSVVLLGAGNVLFLDLPANCADGVSSVKIYWAVHCDISTLHLCVVLQ